MTSGNGQLSGVDVVVLIAPGFEEGPVTFFIEQLRQAGLAVLLTGLAPGLIRSRHGLAGRPDAVLSQLPSASAYRLVIVPGAVQCTSALLAEPRIHRLLQDTLATGGYVAVTRAAQDTVMSAGLQILIGEQRVKLQNGRTHDAFLGELLDLLMDKGTRRD